jgi:hypothetical protein
MAGSIWGQKKKNYFPIWTYHQKNINIHGFAIGLGSLRDDFRHTNTNGFKVEIIGGGILVPLIPESPIGKNSFLKRESLSERINGLSISVTGTVCNCLTNGISTGLIGQINYQVNGFSASALMNFSQIHYGLQAAFYNESYKMSGFQLGGINYSYSINGVQLGLYNNSKKLKGIQIGLWNVNQKRKFPVINWNFKD